MDILIKAAQLVLALVILVTVHEFGHYIFARIFGVKVNRFYLFFNPWFSILKYYPDKGKVELGAWTTRKKGTDGQPTADGEEEPHALLTFNVKKHSATDKKGRLTWASTIYGLGWLPLGGYCDIAGMVDETKDASKLEATPQPWELRSKPAWQRLCVMVAGVCFNFFLAILIYIGIAFHWGDDTIPFQAMEEGMDFTPEFIEAGFRNGDILQTINGEPIDAKDYSAMWSLVQPGARVGVLRDGKPAEVTVSDKLVRQIATKGKDYLPMTMRVPVYVAKVVSGEPAAKAGIRPGDRIVAVAGDTTPAITEFMPALQANKGRTVPLSVIRADGTAEILPTAISDGGRIGIQMQSPLELFDREKINYSLLESVPRGWEIGTAQLSSYVSSLKLIFTKEGAQSLGGFGTLGDLFPTSWNWYSFWQITAFLSIILAFMNIIPIPALDGGYTLFLLVEMITRRKPSDRFLEIANTCGFMLLILLLVYANGNDIYRFFIK